MTIQVQLSSLTLFRICCLIIWTGAIAFATYHVILAADEHLPWQKDPVLNPGPLAWILGRGRDKTDYEWTMFISLIITQLILWFPLYTVLKVIAHVFRIGPQVSCWVSPTMSWFLLQNLMGWKAALFLFLQPVFFYVLMLRRSKSVIWIVALGLLAFLNIPWYRSFTVVNSYADYYFVTTSAWNYARCLSFCFDCWDVKRGDSKGSLISMIRYCFYFPLLITGPLVLYSQFHKDIQQNHTPLSIQRAKRLILDLTRMGFWILVIEVLLHIIYFRPLILTIPVLQNVNLWTLCGVTFWLGQFFMMKYLVMYGISSAFAQFEGLSTPPLPGCIAHVHRYSVIWKDFDRGLYLFLIRYTYLPTLRRIESWDTQKKINPELRKLCASLATFIYVYVWHSVSFDILVWSALNFLGISIEKGGSYLKRRIESGTKQIKPVFWDLVVEPIVTIPLAVMSILNSAIFCGTLPAAITLTQRLLWTDLEYNYSFGFLYCFTHVAIAVRSWKESGSPYSRIGNKQ